MTTRAEHLQWCKDRAMEYVKTGDYNQAITSMLSDLTKHPETEKSGTGICAQIGMFEMMKGPTRESATKYIQGFN